MTTINSSSSYGENLLINLNSGNSYSYTNVLIPSITNKKFVRFLSNINVFVNFNFIQNAYIYDASNPSQLSFSKTAYVGKQEIWYKCESLISQVIVSLNTSLTPLSNSEVVSIVCEFIDFVPKDLMEDV
jgi:hypothetical protein